MSSRLCILKPLIYISIEWPSYAEAVAHIIHERFYCDRRYEAGNHLEVSYSRAKTNGMALDLASAVAAHLAAGFPQPSRQVRRSVGRQTVSSMPSFLAAPRARLAWRLGGFVTNRHE